MRILVVALCLAMPAFASEWTERYFGVGSAGERSVACGQARDHAQGNSFEACIGRRGKRGDAAYTDCVCAATADRMHVCNVNLNVRCDAAAEPEQRGQPRERAGRGVHATARTRRPASEGAAPARAGP